MSHRIFQSVERKYMYEQNNVENVELQLNHVAITTTRTK